MSYYKCRLLIRVLDEYERLKEKVYIVECPEEFEGQRLMTYKQMSYWRFTGELRLWNLVAENTNWLKK